MKRHHLAFLLLISSVAFFDATVAGGQEPSQRTIPNWPAPAFWQPAVREGPSEVSGHRARAQAAISSPLPFIAVAPCRMLDTRPTPIASGANRDIGLTGSPCGIPSNAVAVSANFALFDIIGTSSNGVLKVWPTGSPSTFQALLNWAPTSGQIDNASVVVLGTGGAVTVQPNQGTGSINLVVDVNGYYAGAGVGGSNTFLGVDAGNFTMTGVYNTSIGADTFVRNTSGHRNTVVGYAGLFNNTMGFENTAIGFGALTANISGDSNTAVGVNALLNNTSGVANTAIGHDALNGNTDGYDNTVVGRLALFQNTTGAINTAIGIDALFSNTTGNFNIAIGDDAGFNLTTGSHDIYIGNVGASAESNTIRIGDANKLATYIAGIRAVTTGTANAVPVLIDSAGQLGTGSSSARFKEEIEDMAEASSGLLNLRPVTFRYKGQARGLKQFGLIAEEVEEVLPELVVHDAAGQVEAVLYHEMPAMLLNEIQKQQRQIGHEANAIERQAREIAAQRREIAKLKARLAKLEALLTPSRALSSKHDSSHPGVISGSLRPAETESRKADLRTLPFSANLDSELRTEN